MLITRQSQACSDFFSIENEKGTHSSSADTQTHTHTHKQACMMRDNSRASTRHLPHYLADRYNLDKHQRLTVTAEPESAHNGLYIWRIADNDTHTMVKYGHCAEVTWHQSTAEHTFGYSGRNMYMFYLKIVEVAVSPIYPIISRNIWWPG